MTNDCCFDSVGRLVGRRAFPGFLFLLVEYDVGDNVGNAGQLFIYTTIKDFGPIVSMSTIIMTTRQMISISISSILSEHVMSVKALIGSFPK